MPRNRPFRKVSIDEEIAKAVERRMVVLHRREALTPFIEWVLDLYSRGYLQETPEFKKEIEQQAEYEFVSDVNERNQKREVPARRVRKVVGAKGELTGDEGKRKAS